MAAEIFGKLKAMERHASPPSLLIWLWLLVAFGEPLVMFVTALFEGWSDYRKEYNTPRFSDRHNYGGMTRNRYICKKEENQNGKTI